MDNLTDFSLFFQLAAELLPLVLLITLNKKISLPLTIYLWVTFIASLLLLITKKLHFNNLFIFNSYYLISFISIVIFYFELIKSKKIRFFILLSLIISLMIFLWEIKTSNYIEIALISEKFSVLVFSLLYFVYIISADIKEINYKPYILINTYFLFYGSFGALSNLEIDLLMKTKYWFIHNLVDGLSKLIIVFAIWKQPKTCNT